MIRAQKIFLTLLMIVGATLMATPVLAKGFNVKDAGISLWFFIIIGVMIILLQLIPAAILFFSFIGSASAFAIRREKGSEKDGVKEETPMGLPGHEPLTVEK
jgi:hypothetical protein